MKTKKSKEKEFVEIPAGVLLAEALQKEKRGLNSLIKLPKAPIFKGFRKEKMGMKDIFTNL